MWYIYKLRRNNVNSQSLWFSNIKHKYMNKWANMSELPGSLNQNSFLKTLSKSSKTELSNS